MKTLPTIAMVLLCSTLLAQQKPPDPQLRRQQMEVRRDFDRKASKLNAADLAAIKAVLDKYPDGRATNAPAVKPAPAKKK